MGHWRREKEIKIFTELSENGSRISRPSKYRKAMLRFKVLSMGTYIFKNREILTRKSNDVSQGLVKTKSKMSRN